jgi:Domain of unknown function (DUF4111)/Nucleotidyltransferase domain
VYLVDGPGPTPYPHVNAVLALLLEEVRGILGPRFVGLYLYGSLSSGGFDPEHSDIDFLVVTGEELPADLLPALEAMHRRIASSGLPFGDRLEGSYIPRQALRRYDPANARHPTIGTDWSFGVHFHGPDWVLNRYILREHGVAVSGPPPATLIDPIGPDDLRDAVSGLLATHWTEALQGPDWLRPRCYQGYARLTMCRALYLLETGRLAPKLTAAIWARERLEPRWSALVDQALTWRSDPTPDDMDETIAFIRYATERSHERHG